MIKKATKRDPIKARLGSFAAQFGLSVLAKTNAEGRHVFQTSHVRQVCTDYKSRFITVGDYEFHYKDEGSGPVLVLLHGFGASLHVWDKWVELLSPHFRILRIDLPGFGLSSPVRKKVRIEFFIEQLEAFLDAMQLDSFVLAGNSLGGWLAWEFTALHPDRVERLCLLNAAGYFENSGKPKGIELIAKDKFAQLLRSGVPKVIIRNLAKKSYADRRNCSEDLVHRTYLMSNREGMLASLIYVASSDAKANIHRISTIKIPTLVLWGEKDKVIPSFKADFFYSDMPDCKLIIYKAAGHVPMMELPQQSAQDFLQFVNLAPA